MILRGIEIENFGKFSSVNFEFRRGMNLVAGANEAGKSTLAEAIPATLFGTKQVERFKPWGRSGCSASLVFEGEGRTVEIIRNLLTDEVKVVERDALYQPETRFQGKAPLLGRSAASRKYRALLEDLLGIADLDLFRATCMFGQTVAEWTGDALGEKLRCLVSGSDETDFAGILDGLLAEHFELTRENPWGRDKQRDRQLEQVRAQMAEQADNPAPAVAAAVAEQDSDLAERIRLLAEELEHDRAEYVKGICYIDKLRQNLPETTGAAVASVPAAAAVEQPAQESADPPAPDDVRSRLRAAGLPEEPPENLFELLAEAGRIRQELAESRLPLAALTKSEEQVDSPPWLATGVLTAVLTCVVAAAWFFSLQPMLVTLFSAVGLVAGWGWCLWRSLKSGRTRADLKQQKHQLEQARAATLAQQADLSERCEALGLPSTAVDLVRLQQLADRHRQLLEQWWSSDRSAKPAAEPLPEEAEEAEEAKDAENAENAVPEPSTAAEEGQQAGEELADLERRLAAFAAQLQEKEQELERLQDLAAGAPEGATGGNDPAPASDLQQKQIQLEQRIKLLRTAVDLLVSGVEDFRQSHLSRLTEEASRLFAKVTDGRYPSIRLDDEMRPEIQVDGRRWHQADHFSRGTRDALYLALRVALARVRDVGESLPLLLDDPFVHLDRQRLSATIKLLDMAAAGGQLILLSHSDDLARRAARERWHVISLGGHSAGAGDGEGETDDGQLHLL